MTFGEKKRAIRNLRQTADQMRAAQRGKTASEIGAVSISVPGPVFDDVEWALGHVKVWNAEAQAYERQNFRFVPNVPLTTPALMLRGCVVYRA